jgi:hypothetical protein
MDSEDIKASESEIIEAEFFSDQAAILEEFEAKKPFKYIKLDPHSTSFLIPQVGPRLQKVITLEETECEYKKLVFNVIKTAFHHFFMTENNPPSVKINFITNMPNIVEYLNSYTFLEGKEINFFKSYESFRINKDKIKPASTGLLTLLKCVKLVSALNSFIKDLSSWQRKFINSAAQIKILGWDRGDAEQITLTDWFSVSTWLRRDDVGVGHETYSKLASPKALVNSFVATITAELNDIQLAKDALINFFRVNKIKSSDYPLEKIETKSDDRYAFREERVLQRNSTLNKLRKLFSNDESKDKHLRLAMILVLREFVTPHSIEHMKERFFNNKVLKRTKKDKDNSLVLIGTQQKESLFGSRFLNEVAEYASLPDGNNIDKPKSFAEHVIFSWLMAYQTVQPSDIKKLKLKDFKFVRRNNCRVTHIDLEYFKGRANTIHQVRMLETRSLLGSVILKFIQGFVPESKEDKNKNITLDYKCDWLTVNRIFEFCEEIPDSIHCSLIREKASPVFIKSILLIIRNGIKFNPKGDMSYEGYIVNGDLNCQKKTFSLTAIKNSSIHSRSDTFTPTQLINYHSHSNDVERKHYLSESNEEWLNRSGLITRAVMQDLTTNLYRASKSDRVIFNSEFTYAIETITKKKNDILVQMKMITGAQSGDVNHLGLLKKVDRQEDDADTIYMLDTPETLLKLLHYLDQVKENHHLLATSSSEFLLFTVLPTAEWIEELFDKKLFSKKSMTDGRNMYKKFKAHLPPLFKNQIS